MAALEVRALRVRKAAVARVATAADDGLLRSLGDRSRRTPSRSPLLAIVEAVDRCS